MEQQLLALREQKGRIEDDANKWAERRDKLNEQSRNLRIEISNLRNARDETNEKVRQLKQQREKINADIREKIEQTKKLDQERKAVAEKRPRRSHESLQKEVESLDWKIQTTSLTVQEEREHVEQIKQLEIQLNVYKKIEKLVRQVSELREEVRRLKTESMLLHGKVTEEAQKSRETHERMLSKVEELKKMKTEADNLHKQFLDVKTKAKPAQDQIAKLRAQIARLRGEVKEEELKEKREAEDALRESLAKQAMDKLKRGEKLSWEEFQLLAEKGMIA